MPPEVVQVRDGQLVAREDTVPRVSPEPRLPIETARLRLRRLVPGDLAALHAIHSREDVTRWLYWNPRDEDEVRAVLEAHIARPSDEGVLVAIDLEGELIGTVNVAVGEHRQGEVGFMLHPDHQGHGYATEAAEAIVELAFGTYRLHRVYGCVEPRNTASARLLERLGMRKEGHLVENEWVKGEWQSEAVYAILAREWRAARECR
jgi:RimJ/RimL family protein N-acetyltransferase